MNWVTCPKCGHRWRYRGKGKAIQCSRCKFIKIETTYISDRREKQRSNGLCVEGCGRPLVTACYCEICRRKHNERSKKQRLAYVAKGLCYAGCGRPRGNTRYCELCRIKNKERLRKSYARRKAKLEMNTSN